jgi:GWxTD domain-containing protein
MARPVGAGDDATSHRWHTGPARYLLTRAEAQAFKQLKTEVERAGFIEAFWLRRDPTPETARNEFREEFERRIRETEALRLYQITTKEMWRTDPGKIFILLGPPISQERDQNASSQRDMVIWRYDRAEGVRERNFNVVFVADESGELRLSESPLLDRMTTRGLASPTPNRLMRGAPEPPGANSGGVAVANNIRAMNAIGAAAAGGASNYAEAKQLIDGMGWGSYNLLDRTGRVFPASAFLGDPVLASIGGDALAPVVRRRERLASVQVGDRRPLETEVRTRSSFEPLPVQLHTDFYRALDGTTYTAFTLEPAHRPALEVAARLRPFGGIISLDDPQVSYSFAGKDLFAAAGDGAPATFQTGLGVDPGRYRMLFGLEDPVTGRVGVVDQPLEVPTLEGGALRLSSLTLARELRALQPEEKSHSDLKVPFVLGTLRVVPRTDARLRRHDDFQLYYQVYGAGAGLDGQLDLEVAYAFAAQTPEGWQPLGKPIPQPGLTGGAQSWAFPLDQWPNGRFRLTVTVTDHVTEQVAGETLTFEVVD